MSKKHRDLAMNRAPAKPGQVEHRPLPGASANMISVSRRIVPNPDGTSGMEVSVNLDGAAAPDRRYTAEFAYVDIDADFVRILFGQRRMNDSSRPRSIVIVKMSPESVNRLLAGTEEFLRRAGGFLDRNKIGRQALQNPTGEPDQAVMLTANLFAIAQVSRECCFDFYHASAWELRATVKVQEIAVDPIVRVDAPTSLVIPILERLVELQAKLPKDAT
jgi:hypothetical protein